MIKKIAGERLKPKTDLFSSDLDALAVDSFGPKCMALLRKTDWKDLAAGFIGLTLGSDNRRVLLTNLYLVGRLHKSEQAVTTVKASKFWPKITGTCRVAPAAGKLWLSSCSMAHCSLSLSRPRG